MRQGTTGVAGQASRTACILAVMLSAASVSSLAIGGESTPTTAQGLRVVGTVADAEGTLVSGAIASLVCWDPQSRAYRVVSQTTDNEGRYDFHLPAGPGGAITVVGWKSGHAIGIAKHAASLFDGQLPASATVQLPIRLLKAKPLILHVVDAEGAAVKGGRIGVTGLLSDDRSLSFGTRRVQLHQLTRDIDANGQVTLDYLGEGRGAALQVDAPGNGSQNFSIAHHWVSNRVTLELLPAGTVNVSLVSDDPDSIRRRELVIESRLRPPPTAAMDKTASIIQPFGSVVTVTTNSAGKATAMVAAGRVTVQVARRPHDRMFPKTIEPASLAPGGTLDVKITLEPGVKARGRVLTQRDEPVGGVKLTIAGATATTGADGRFEFWLPASRRTYGHVMDVPPGFAWPYQTFFSVPAADDADSRAAEPGGELLVPTIRCHKATPLSGMVVDELAVPVPLASVSAAWVQTSEVGRSFTLKSELTQTDGQGRFQFRHVLPDVDARVTAQTGGKATMAATVIHTGSVKQLKLDVVPGGLLSIRGSIQGSDGPAIPNATIQIARAFVSPDGHQYGTRPVQWNGRRTFSSGGQGRFTSPASVPRFGKYSIRIVAPGYMTVETPFLAPPESGSVWDLGTIKMTKARMAAGVVHDSAGNPLPGASVWAYAVPRSLGRIAQRSRVETDAEGRFTLSQLHPQAAIATVKKDGYRVSGGPLLVGQPRMDITLFRRDQPVSAEHRVRPRCFDDARRHAAARRLLEAMLPKQSGAGYFSTEGIAMLARFDRAAALAEVEKSQSASLRANVLATLGEILDATAEAEAIEDAYRRAFARYAILDQIKDPEQARDLLATTLLDAQSIRRPDRRILVIASVAERFARLGDLRRAEQILRGALPQALQLSTKEWPGYARASFAERLARFDPDAALKMVSEADAEDQERHYRNIAQTLAAINPDAAEVALERIGQHRYVDAPAVRVAYGMASVDLPRAIRLLDRIDKRRLPVEKARGLGVIAMAIKDSDPKQARELLGRAFEALPDQQGAVGNRSRDVFGAAIALLRFAETVDPHSLTEYYWRALQHDPGPDAGAWSSDTKEVENANRLALLALALSLYDAMPDLPQQIMEPVFAYWERQIGRNSSRFTDCEATFMAMALTDPQRAADWAIRFDAKLDKKLRRYIPQPWEVIGRTLTSDRDVIGERMMRDVYHRWVIGQYDL